MEIIKWLNENAQGPVIDTLEKLKTDLGIRYSNNPKYPNLYLLNYSQIDSPKNHPVVNECRSLVLQFDRTWSVVSRSFDRFYNYGENGYTPDISEFTAHEKMDGSLISVFMYKGEWLYRTRKMIMPEGHIHDNEWSAKWSDVIEDGLGPDWKARFMNRSEFYTYIFEITAPDNRVVVQYDKRQAYLLAVRHNTSGRYSRGAETSYPTPGTYAFKTLEDCVAAAQALPNLGEGYVLYNERGVPTVKIKNPAYVAAHHLRGEGPLTPRRVMDLLIIGEVDEYLSVFPEDRERIDPYIDAWDLLWEDVESAWNDSKRIEDQKEFAMHVRQYRCQHLLFRMRQGQKPREAFDQFQRLGKYRFIEGYLNV